MKSILEFNLPEEQEEFMLAVRGKDIMLVLYQLDQHLREKIKYPSDTVTQDTYDTYIEIREKLNDLMNDNNVSFELFS
jgi:hypothetical protein